MSEERHETVTDNVSANHQFREVSKMIPHEEVTVSKMETTTPTNEKSSAVGNAAAMREALEKTKSVIATCMEILNKIPDWCDYDGLVDEVADELCDLRDSHVKAALSAPPRNCDVGTAEDQEIRYQELCDSHTCGSICSRSGCPLYAYDCSPFAWAQMPYEEGGAE